LERGHRHRQRHRVRPDRAYYSADPERIAYAKREFHVGTLHQPQVQPARWVGNHPFGGFQHERYRFQGRRADYLLLFTQAKSIGHKLP
jgi:1-pyrroline-5-carboxylate dehydrogenase